MVSIEVRLFSNQRLLSLDELADIVAAKVAERLRPEIKPAPQPVQRETRTPLLVSVKDASQLSGLGRSTIWNLIKQQRLQPVRIGGRTLITAESLHRLLHDKTQRRDKR